MDRKKKAKKLLKEIEGTNPERLENYMKMYDRILLYTLAANLMPKEAMEGTLDICEKIVKKGIEVESQYRTNFLESTPQGRISKIRNEPDGESVRLNGLKTWDLVKRIISSNIDGFSDNSEDYENYDNE